MIRYSNSIHVISISQIHAHFINMVKAVKIRKYITSVNMGNITSTFYLKLRYGKKCQQKHTIVKYICTNTLSLSLSLSETCFVRFFIINQIKSTLYIYKILKFVLCMLKISALILLHVCLK